jgi:anti-anti-sigma factor
MPDIPTARPSSLESVAICHTAHFATRWLHPSTAIVTAHGDIDAANAHDFATFALRHVDRVSNLVIDLSGVEFFGSAGLSALHTLNVQCAANGVSWALASSKAVSRLLRICDPDSTLPVRPSVVAAIGAVTGEPRRLLQLVPQSR